MPPMNDMPDPDPSVIERFMDLSVKKLVLEHDYHYARASEIEDEMRELLDENGMDVQDMHDAVLEYARKRCSQREFDHVDALDQRIQDVNDIPDITEQEKERARLQRDQYDELQHVGLVDKAREELHDELAGE